MAGHVLNSTTPDYRVQVMLDGTVLADTTDAVALTETGCPVRHYLPRADVRMDLLHRTGTSTHCPFKGDTEYFAYSDYDDLAWSYPGEQSTREDLTDRIAFSDERVQVFIDGALRG